MSINEISLTLNRFICEKKIKKEDVETTFKSSIKEITEKQARVLSDGRLSLESQRVMFGALRALKNTLDSMYLALLEAEKRHENPTTAVRCNEVIPFVADVANQVAKFNPYTDSNDEKLESIFSLTRNLRKKASTSGFSKSIDEELKEINMSPDEINNFIGNLTQNIQNKIDF